VSGFVSLVGAGPGDPELITVKGRRALERADVVVHDHLANEALLQHAPRALHIYAGKKKADHALKQEEICALLIEHARAGRRVVRLKGGDPYLFGRGGEEAEALSQAGIPFDVIPGVTAPLGIAAYCGVPLTHREHTSVVTFLTGHDPDLIDWSKTAGAETLVIYMGLTTIGEISRRLIEAGRAAGTPAIAVRWATRPEQQTVRATLGELPAAVAEAHLKPPATIIVGDVAALGGELNWYERLPLFGKRIVVTRAEDQAAESIDALRALGADAIELPSISIQPPESWMALDTAIERLDQYDWLIFTSVNGVRFFTERLDRSPRDLRRLRARIAVIGDRTRAAVEALHLKADVMPGEFVAESLLESLAPHEMAGQRVLIPRAAVARDILPESLRKRGAVVDVVEAYRTAIPADATERTAAVFSRHVDWITFTSSSTVKNLLAIAGRDKIERAKLASIGPVTSQTMRMHGLRVDVEAHPHTMADLIAAIQHLS